MRTEGWTDMTKLIVAFREIAKSAKKSRGIAFIFLLDTAHYVFLLPFSPGRGRNHFPRKSRFNFSVRSRKAPISFVLISVKFYIEDL